MYNRSSIILIIFLLAYPISVFSQEKKRLEYVPGELLVKFRSGVSRHLAQATHRSFGSRAIKRFRRINVDHIKIPEGWSVEEAVAIYRLDPDVEYVEPNYIRRVFLTPNDPDFDKLWGLHNTGQEVIGTSGTEDADIDAPEAWDTQTGSSGVVVAVIDTGTDLDHEDLTGNIWRNSGEDWVDGSPGNNGEDDDGNGKIDDYYGWDFVNGDNNPDDDNSQDESYHGTHVTGIIAARGNNNIGTTGVCWSASIMPLKILDAKGNGSVANELAAIQYALDQGATIINVSLGGSGYSSGEYEAIESARDAGLLFVAAAGNDGTDNDSTPVYPASYDLDNIVAVAATDYNDNLAFWSNYGYASVDVAAPGVDIYNTKADNSYQYQSGSSMASPHVSGLAALIWAADQSLTYTQIKDRILNGVDTGLNLEGKILTGGRINAKNSIVNAPSPPTILAVISVISVISVSISKIYLIWIDNSYGETGFKIERKTGSEGTYSQIATVDANVTSYIDTGLSKETTYYYRVMAYNGSGNSSYSNEASDTTFSSGGRDRRCFIATAVYGSEDHPYVKILRRFRDTFLLDNATGRKFVQIYYYYSSSLADVIEHNRGLRALMQYGMIPIIGLSAFFLYASPFEKYILCILFLLFICRFCYPRFLKKNRQTFRLSQIFS